MSNNSKTGTCIKGIPFRICQLGFIVAQLLSWYIIITYTFVILPYAEPTSNPTLNIALIILNYIFHAIFIFLHHWSHWRIFL